MNIHIFYIIHTYNVTCNPVVARTKSWILGRHEEVWRPEIGDAAIWSKRLKSRRYNDNIALWQLKDVGGRVIIIVFVRRDRINLPIDFQWPLVAGGWGSGRPPVFTRASRGAYEFRRIGQITYYYCTAHDVSAYIVTGEILSLVCAATGCAGRARWIPFGCDTVASKSDSCDRFYSVIILYVYTHCTRQCDLKIFFMRATQCGKKKTIRRITETVVILYTV